MDQQLLARLEHWHEENKYQLIIDTIESLPQEQITPELVSQLARAYNNLGTVGEHGLFQKAADLLLSVREELEETNHNCSPGMPIHWNSSRSARKAWPCRCR